LPRSPRSDPHFPALQDSSPPLLQSFFFQNEIKARFPSLAVVLLQPSLSQPSLQFESQRAKAPKNYAEPVVFRSCSGFLYFRVPPSPLRSPCTFTRFFLPLTRSSPDDFCECPLLLLSPPTQKPGARLFPVPSPWQSSKVFWFVVCSTRLAASP